MSDIIMACLSSDVSFLIELCENKHIRSIDIFSINYANKIDRSIFHINDQTIRSFKTVIINKIYKAYIIENVIVPLLKM